jgi:pimeloyl-ACP methyl ester carboxylesterase
MAVVTEKATPQSSANGVETLTLKVGDDSIFLRKAGEGPPVLLLHGGACDSADWVETMVPLSGSYTFYAPDLVGYGQSDRNRDGYYLSDFTDSTKGLIEALGLDSPLVIVGHSLGGRVALDIALNHPDKVRKLALIDTTGFSRLARWGSFLGTMAYLIRRLLGRPQPYPRFMMENGAVPDWVCLDRLPELKIPTLILWNRRDPYYTVKGALRAKELMPQAQLEIMPRYGHAPHRTERDSFNKLLAAFLAQP